MAIIQNHQLLRKLSFISDDSVKYFRLCSTDEKQEIIFEYIPKVYTDYLENDYELFIFENNYLDAENDVFQVYDVEKDIRLGWLFPITILESNDNNFADNEHLNRYKYVAFRKLILSDSIDYKVGIDINKLSISDIYSNNAIILILSKKQLKNIDDFKIENYLPTLASFGYYLRNEHKLTASFKINKDFALKRRGNVRLNLKKSKRDLTKLFFFKHLYLKYLKTIDHHLIRFHILYQVIEHFIGESFEYNFETLIENYQKGILQKNDFFEKIYELKKERENIRFIFECLNKFSSSELESIKIDLKRDCITLLETYSPDSKDHLGDLIYDVRNLVVHNYRNIKEEEIVLLENITFELELVINVLIENYSPQQCI